MPIDQNAISKAHKIFERICDVFDEKDITPSPVNYQVWFEYFKGDKPKFRQEMDAILNDEYGYNDRTGRRLYDEYLKDEEINSDLDRVFKRLVDAMIKRLTSWTEKLESQNEQLDGFANQLAEPNLDADQLKEITHSVLNTTTDLRNDNLGFKKALLEATQEIQTLRKQLIEARAENMKDELTELGNRRAFNLTLENLTDQFSDQPERLHLVMTDIDHFKTFNDRFGHLVGDSVLRYFANTMRKNQEANHDICRYGGEEFAIIISDANLEQAQKTAETIRMAIQTVHLKRKDTDEALPAITASFGIAQFRSGESVESFVERADTMLYRAKQKGRNCCVTEFDPQAS